MQNFVKHVVSVFILLALCGFSMFSVKDDRYYRQHPDELQKALILCPKQTDAMLSCDDMVLLAKEINALSYDLQKDPQLFGQKITTLQTLIINQEKSLKLSNTNHDLLKEEISKNKKQLMTLLSIVKWLESPQG
jgi:hypothetical protein